MSSSDESRATKRSRSSDRGIAKEKKEKKEKKDKKDKKRERGSGGGGSSGGGGLSSEAQAIIDALSLKYNEGNQQLGNKIDNVDNKVTEMGARVQKVEEKQEQAKRFDDMEKKHDDAIEKLRTEFAGKGTGGGDGGKGEGKGGGGKGFVPKFKRRTVVFLGFKEDTLKEEIIQTMKNFVATEDDVEDWVVFGKWSNFGKVVFKNPGSMWSFLKAKKGTKASHGGKQLTHKVDKPFDERQVENRVGKAIRILRTHLTENVQHTFEQAKEQIDGDYDKGFVMVKVVDGTWKKIATKKKTEEGEKVELELVENPPTLVGLNNAAFIEQANSDD